MFGTLPFLLYIVLQVALFVFRILLLHSDRLSGHRLRIFYRVPAFLPVSLRFSDVSGHNPVVVLNSVFYFDIPRLNNPVPVSLLSGDRKPQIRFLGNHHSGSGNLYHKSFRM